MTVVASKRKSMPPPPSVMYEALTQPNRDPARPWMGKTTQQPRILESDFPSLVVWSSLWAARPDATIRFDLEPGAGGTYVRWTLSLDEPLPDDSTILSMRTKIGRLIFAELRHTFGQ
jgi:hypothetical protein